MVNEWRENAITRGGAEKYYFVICFSVDTSTPELASMESTCFASVTGVAFAKCKRTYPLYSSSIVLYNFVKIVHVKRRRKDCLRRRPSDISRVSDDAYRRDASLLLLWIASWRFDKCDGRLRVVLQKWKDKKRERMTLKWTAKRWD